MSSFTLLTAKDIEERTGGRFSAQRVWDLWRKNLLPYVAAGRRRFISEEQWDKWVAGGGAKCEGAR